MKCPFCGNIEDKVLDTRPTDESASIRRRRECLSCNKRFTTYEVYESPTIIVVKKHGEKQPFDRSKILSGLMRACQKRPVDIKMLEEVTNVIEQEVKALNQAEVQTSDIGNILMEKLKKLDTIAYVRFASVYKDFNSVEAFMNELHSLTGNE